MKYTNNFNLPDAFVSAVTNDTYSSGMSDITVTQLIAPPIQRILLREHDAELHEDVSDRLWALMGSAAHAVLDRATPSELTEMRLYMDVYGWMLGGMFDNLNLSNGVLSDYKMTSVYSLMFGEKPEWTKQLNVLAELAIMNGADIRALQIVVLARDWSKGKAFNPDYPKCPVQVVNVPLWLPSERDMYIRDRVRLHQAAEVAYAEGGAAALTECNKDERWEDRPVFAVMKEGRKSAVKLHDTSDSAQLHLAELGTKHYVVERPGIRKRCQNYCVLSKCNACPFYKLTGVEDEGI